MSDAVPALEKGNVRFSQEMLAEVDRGHPVVRVQKDHVQSIALRRGFRAARPIIQSVLGFAPALSEPSGASPGAMRLIRTLHQRK